MSNFEFDGEKYKQASKHQKETGNKLISELSLKGNEDILDLGCGDGVLTNQLSMLVPNGKAIGVDASDGMLQSARLYQRDNLSFMCLDINNMVFNNCFDVIFSNAALHWIKDHEKLLHNCYQALKPGGIILWNFAGDGTCSHFNAAIKEVMNMSQYREYYIDFEWPWYMPSRIEYINVIEKSGFSWFDVIEETPSGVFDTIDEMTRWIEQPTIVPFLRPIPTHKKDEFLKIVINMMIQRTNQPDGSCIEIFKRLIVKAKK